MDADGTPILSLWASRPGAGDVATAPDWPRVDGIAGSPAQALARARAAFPGRDVLVLQAGARLPAAFATRLLAAWRGSGLDVLSPLDEGWPLPPGFDDACAWSTGEHAVLAWDEASPVCALWRGDAMPGDDGRPVAGRAGLLPALLVTGGEPPARAPVPALASLAAPAMPAGPTDRPVLLHVLHAWGGGAERFVRDLAAADDSRRHLVLVARGDHDRPPFGRRLCLHADLDAAPLRTWPLAAPIADSAIASREVAAVMAELQAEWGIGAVLVSSLVGHSLDVLRTGLPTAWCAHDAFPFWPCLHDRRDPAHEPFDAEALARVLAASGPGVFATHEAGAWWRLRDATLQALSEADAMLVAPSRFARDRLLAIAPALAARRWQVIGHGQAPLPAAPVPTRAADAPLRVLVPGRLHGDKGGQLLDALLPVLPAGVELVLVGGGPSANRYAGRGGVHVLHDYAHADLAAHVQAIAPDLALLPSTVPETWSYALSEMLAMRLPVLCAGQGALAERSAGLPQVRCVPPTAAAFADALAGFVADRAALAAMRAAEAAPLPSPAGMAAAWREALPARAPSLRLPLASPARITSLQLAHDAAEGRRALAQARRQLAEQQDELDRRADWARSLELDAQAAQADRSAMQSMLDAALQSAAEALAQASAASAAASADAGRAAERIAALSAERDELAATMARLGEQLEAREAALAEAHGYYQRDTTDLARQRDVALAQRDAAAAERDQARARGDEALGRLRQFEASTWWRLGTAPRAAVHGLRRGLASLRYRLGHARALAGRGLASLRSRGIAATARRVLERLRPPPPPASPAPAAPVVADLATLRLPDGGGAPRASIIVPVYNQLPVTLACLQALADAGESTAFEVILVDDHSSDDSPRVLPGIPGLRYQRNERNLGFIGACNAGAARARGEFLVFLNNDTTVQPGWLDALLATFASHPDTGLAGSKLVYPDGRLQEAGGIVFADGSGWNYGRFDDPAHPRYSHVREVDYCSGAAIALPRTLFERLGGFDAHYAPAYYEDTDLAMRVRQAGLKVRYQPASVVVHHEGISSGTDTSSGVKAWQVVNHGKFLARWREVLAASHPAPGTDPHRAARHRDRRRVLVLDACTPTPDRDSGSVRMLALMRLLREEGCSVVFFPENRAHDGRYTEALQQLGVEAWWHPWLHDVPAWIAAHGAGFDLVIGSRHYVLAPLLPLLREHAPRAHVVFDTVDLHHLREQREAEFSGDPARLRAAERTRRTELALIAQSDTTWVVSAAERELLAAEAPSAHVQVVSNIHDVATGEAPGPAARAGLVFVGGYRHPPNVDAACWLVAEILPLVRARRPDCTLHLVGGDAPPEVVALGAQPGVVFHGYVPELGPLLDAARVAVAPLRYGAGVKGKVNQALAHGLPVVATTCAVEGMHLRDGEDVLVADAPDAFAGAVLRLLDDEALWHRLSAGGRENTRRHFSPEVVRQPLRELLASLGRR